MSNSALNGEIYRHIEAQPDELLTLLNALLTVDPKHRSRAEDALQSDFLRHHVDYPATGLIRPKETTPRKQNLRTPSPVSKPVTPTSPRLMPQRTIDAPASPLNIRIRHSTRRNQTPTLQREKRDGEEEAQGTPSVLRPQMAVPTNLNANMPSLAPLAISGPSLAQDQELLCSGEDKDSLGVSDELQNIVPSERYLCTDALDRSPDAEEAEEVENRGVHQNLPSHALEVNDEKRSPLPPLPPIMPNTPMRHKAKGKRITSTFLFQAVPPSSASPSHQKKQQQQQQQAQCEESPLRKRSRWQTDL